MRDLDNLLRRCKEHDKGAFEELFVEMAQLLDRRGRRLGLSLNQAEDAVQETFYRLLLKIHLYDPGKVRNPGGYLYAVHRRVVVDLFRANLRADILPDRDDVLNIQGLAIPSAEDEHEYMMARRRVEDCFDASWDRLSDEQRQALEAQKGRRGRPRKEVQDAKALRVSLYLECIESEGAGQ